MTARESHAVPGILRALREMLARTGARDAADRAEPEARSAGAADARGIGALVGEISGHLIAELAAEVVGQQAQQAAEPAILSVGHDQPSVRRSNLESRAASTSDSSRSASARATARPNGVSRYALRRASSVATSATIPPSSSRLTMP